VAKRRARGDGSVYFDASNRVWIGALDAGADAAGKRRRLKVSGRTRTLALASLRELRRRVETGDVTTHDRITVRQAVDDFLGRGLPPQLASNTRYVLCLYAGRFADHCGGRRLRDLTTRDVEDWLQHLATEGKAHRTLVAARSTAGRSLDHAVRQGWLPAGRNVAKLAQLPKGRQTTQRPRQDDAAVRTLILAAGDDRWAPLLATIAVTGCRVGEAIAQTWSDIDGERNVIRITSGARHEANRGGITRQEPKRGSSRPVNIPSALTLWLVLHRRRVLAESLAAGRPAPDLAFPTAAGSMVNRRTIDRWLDKVAERAAVDVKGWHDLRHALATSLGDGGTPLTRTAAILGHRSVDTTSRVYTHPTVAADAAVPRGERLLKR